MKPARDKRTGRGAFTLVELLLVMAIIGVLIAILLPAIMPALNKRGEVQNRVEMSQLAAAVVSFQTKFNVPYMPSRIRLSEDGTFLPPSGIGTLDVDSQEYLRRLWPRLTYPVDWNGDGDTVDNTILEGQQCLVFFLGGIPSQPVPALPPFTVPPGCMGFSTNPINPNGPGARMPAFYEFKSNRLVPTASGFHVYQDAYETTAYAYFSSYKSSNGYNRYYAPLPPALAISDCPSLGVWPYAEALGAAPRYMKPNGFQIISAGRDGLFGQGSNPAWGPPPALWSPATAGTTPARFQIVLPNGPVGMDDMANFHDAKLGQ